MTDHLRLDTQWTCPVVTDGVPCEWETDWLPSINRHLSRQHRLVRIRPGVLVPYPPPGTDDDPLRVRVDELHDRVKALEDQVGTEG